MLIMEIMVVMMGMMVNEMMMMRRTTMILLTVVNVMIRMLKLSMKMMLCVVTALVNMTEC